MALCFAQFGDPPARAAHSRAVEAARLLWGELDAGAPLEGASRLLRQIDPRLGLEPGPGPGRWGVTYAGLEARGAAELAAAQAAGTSLRVSVGRPARPYPLVLEELQRLHRVDLSAARVRGGFTRGHLLELVLALPAVPGDPQEVAEELVDALLGEALVDDWVVAIGTTPLPRSGPLRVLQGGNDRETYPLPQLGELLASATAAVEAQLPATPLWQRPVGAEWVWLELEPTSEGMQPERLAAVTWLPELLKCALEGLPFHSRRFSRWGERFVWLRSPAVRGAARVERRERVEKTLDEALRGAGCGAVVGTGFGERDDFFDLCLGEQDAALGALLDVVRGLQLGAELGFYDTRWAEERLEVG